MASPYKTSFPTTPLNGILTVAGGSHLSTSTPNTFKANQGSNNTITLTTDATSANTVGTIVARDSSGNFSAGAITSTSLTTSSVAAASSSATNLTLNQTGDVSIGRDLSVPGTSTLTGVVSTGGVTNLYNSQYIFSSNLTMGGQIIPSSGTLAIQGNLTATSLTINSITPSTANTYLAGVFPAAGKIGNQLTGTNNTTSIPVGANNIALYTMANVPAGVYIISANTFVNTSPGLQFRIMRGAVEVAGFYSEIGNITAALTAIDTNTTTSTYQLQVFNNGAACTLAINNRFSFFEFVRIA